MFYSLKDTFSFLNLLFSLFGFSVFNSMGRALYSLICFIMADLKLFLWGSTMYTFVPNLVLMIIICNSCFARFSDINLHMNFVLSLRIVCAAYKMSLSDWSPSQGQMNFSRMLCLSFRSAHSQLPSWERNPDKHVVQIISRWLQTTG